MISTPTARNPTVDQDAHGTSIAPSQGGHSIGFLMLVGVAGRSWLKKAEQLEGFSWGAQAQTPNL
jgi:hypothetical protein